MAAAAKDEFEPAAIAAGQDAKAYRMLANISNWFTEGFDTKDLQEAKALLDSLESQTV